MYEDPIGDLCQRILIVFYCLLMMAALAVYYVYTAIRLKIILTGIAIWRVYNEVYFFFRLKWNRLYYRHIWTWFAALSPKRPRTWAEIEQYRQEVSARCGYEIPRTLSMEEGLKQEGYLQH